MSFKFRLNECVYVAGSNNISGIVVGRADYADCTANQYWVKYRDEKTTLPVRSWFDEDDLLQNLLTNS